MGILELYKVAKLRIISSRFFKNKIIGKFTCHESKGASVVDYLLIDYNIWNISTIFEVHDISISLAIAQLNSLLVHK